MAAPKVGTLQATRAGRLAASEALAHDLTTVTTMEVRVGEGRLDEEHRSRQGTTAGDRRRLQDAKTRLSEVVRLARAHRPRYVTIHGRDAVVVIGAENYDRLRPPLTGAAIVEALRHSPLREVEIECVPIEAPIRDVEL